VRVVERLNGLDERNRKFWERHRSFEEWVLDRPRYSRLGRFLVWAQALDARFGVQRGRDRMESRSQSASADEILTELLGRPLVVVAIVGYGLIALLAVLHVPAWPALAPLTAGLIPAAGSRVRRRKYRETQASASNDALSARSTPRVPE
jgi:hypothetical protein